MTCKKETSKNFWTVKDGQVGTAHYNRAGEMVDFRAVNFAAHKAVDVIGRPPEYTAVKINPPKGVDIAPIQVDVVAQVDKKTGEDDTHEFFVTCVKVVVEGVEVEVQTAVRGSKEKTTPEAKEIFAARAAANAEQWKQLKAAEAVHAQKVARIGAMTAQEIVDKAAPTKAEFGKMGGAKWKAVFTEVVTRAWKQVEAVEFPDAPRDSVAVNYLVERRDWQEWAQSRRDEIVAVAEAERARRKAEFMAKQEQGQ